MALKADICQKQIIASVCKVADSGIQRANDEVIISDSRFVYFEKSVDGDSFNVGDSSNLHFEKNVGWTARNPLGCSILGTLVLGRSCTNRNVPLGTELVVLEDSVSVYRFDGTDTREFLLNDSIGLVSEPSVGQNSVKGDSASVTDVAAIGSIKSLDYSVTATDSKSVTFIKNIEYPANNSLGSFILGTQLLGSSYNTDQPDTPVYMSDEVNYSLTLGKYGNANDSISVTDAVSVSFSVEISDDIGTDDSAGPHFYRDAADSVTLTEVVITSVGNHEYVYDSIYPIYDSPLEWENKSPDGDEALMTDIVSVQLFRYGTLGTAILGTKILG